MADMFKDAKVGDKVAIPYNDGSVGQYEIARLTPTQVIVGVDRYSRDNGGKVGSRDGCIRPWSDAHAQQAARFKASRRLSNATHALYKIAAAGWGMPMQKDSLAADALAEQIEAYLAAAGAK